MDPDQILTPVLQPVPVDLDESPKLVETYFAFADARKIERAAAWLAEEGYAGRLPPRMAALTETPVPRHTGVDG